MLQVIKVGGAALADASWLERFGAAMGRAGERASGRVVVHGGGPDITELSARLGIETEFHNGRRVTSAEALDVTSMVLNGRVNKRIVRALRAQGLDAFGVSGEDGGLITGKLRDNGALGRVGEVLSVRSEILKGLIEAGMLPVVSPVSIGTDFGALNINADDAATAIAQKLEADELLFLTDVPGVRENEKYHEALSCDDARKLITSSAATGGMALKLRAALGALDAGVAKVRIGSLDMLFDVNAGTALHAEALECR